MACRIIHKLRIAWLKYIHICLPQPITENEFIFFIKKYSEQIGSTNCWLGFQRNDPIPLIVLHINLILWLICSQFTENEEDTLNNQVDQDSSTILNECKRDASKRRPSLAQKMTSNLRRLSGATELKIDINDSIAPNNPKYCNKKIKVSHHHQSSFVHGTMHEFNGTMQIFGKMKPKFRNECVH